jgi:hypothetical protein
VKIDYLEIRVGRRTSSPPQLGQVPFKISLVQRVQNVHSKEQIIASSVSFGKLTSHFSQLLFISNIAPCLRYFRTFIAKPSTIESYLLLLVTFGGVKFSEIIAIR